MNSKQFLKEGFIEDAHEAHMDHEVQMARVDCYYAAEHAIVLHKLLRNISEEQGLEGWVASKITLANDYLKSVREHLEYQMMNTDADEEDFLPLAEGLTSVKKKLSEAADSKDIQEFERGPWYIIVKGEVVPEDDGSPRKFNWLNAAKVFFRKMLDDDPTTAAQLKSEYDNATDKKSVVYYSKKLPSVSSDNSSLEESEKRPGLWANIRAKRERIKAGSGERMRKPGSKGAPTNKDLKSIRASSESMHEDGLNLDQQKSDFKNPLNLNLGSVRGLPINAGIQSAQTPQSYSNRPGASSMGLQPSLSIGNPESGPFAQISKQGGMVGYKKTFEGLGPEQKRVGQLGPTEKVKKNSGARGKLVGANESVGQGVAEGYEPGDKITWYHSNHHPEIEGTVVGWKDGHLIVKSIDPQPRNTEKTVAKYRVPKNNILSHDKQGVAEGSDSLRGTNEPKKKDAWGEGYWVGHRREDRDCPYPPGSFDAEMWELGYHEGNKDRKNEMTGRVAEGKWSHNAITGQKLDPRTGEILPVKEKPLTMKQMFAPKAQPKLTLDDVWRKVENVVSQIYPDGDPNDYMAPWLEKHGIRDFKIGEILDRAAKKNGYKDMYDYWNSMGEQGMAEGLPGSLSASDYMPGATLPHTNWNCIKCSGHKFMYSLDGKLTKDNKKGAIRVKCPDCGGSGLKKPDPGHDYFGRKKEEGVAEGSNDLYQKAIRKYAQQVANDYLNGGNEYLYGANKFDAEMFGVSQEKANKDFKTWFTMIVRSQAVRPRRGVAEGSESKISKCASLAAKYFNSEGLQRQYDIDEYIKANAKQGVAEGLGKDLAKLGGMAAVGIGAGIGGSYLDSKHPKIEIGGQQAYLIKDPGWGKIPNTAMKLQGADGRTYIVWTSSGKGNRTLFATPAENVKEGVAEGYKEPTTAAGHAKMAAKIKKMLDDTLADRGDRHGNPDPQRLASAYEYHTQKAKEKSQGVAEGSLKEDEYDKYETGKMGQEEAVTAMFTRLARQGIDPIDMIANRFGWSTYELDDLAQQQGFENTAEWLNSFEQGVVEGSFSPQEYGKQLQTKINQDAINKALVLKKQKQNLGNRIIANTIQQQLAKKGVAASKDKSDKKS